MVVRLWTWWRTLDGELHPPGEELEVAASEGAAICQSGAGEPIRDGKLELGVIEGHEHAVTRRTKRKKGRR